MVSTKECISACTIPWTFRLAIIGIRNLINQTETSSNRYFSNETCSETIVLNCQFKAMKWRTTLDPYPLILTTLFQFISTENMISSLIYTYDFKLFINT